MEPAAEQPVVLEPDPDVERGLKASVKVFQFAKDRLDGLNDEETATITKALLRPISNQGMRPEGVRVSAIPHQLPIKNAAIARPYP